MIHHCKMKGFLSFLILWIVNKEKMTGAEIALELEKRKGHKPSPGTIYPVLKDLKEKGLLKIDNGKRYDHLVIGSSKVPNSNPELSIFRDFQQTVIMYF